MKKKELTSMCTDIGKERPRKRRGLCLDVVFIIILGLIVYSNSLNGQFIWDDALLIKDNRYIKSFFEKTVYSRD